MVSVLTTALVVVTFLCLLLCCACYRLAHACGDYKALLKEVVEEKKKKTVAFLASCAC
jgi:fumarate reductase subunit D